MSKSTIKVVDQETINKLVSGYKGIMYPKGFQAIGLRNEEGTDINAFLKAFRDEAAKQAQARCNKSAPNKRARQFKENITAQLEMRLRDFKENYYDRYTTYAQMSQASDIVKLKEDLEEAKTREEKGNGYYLRNAQARYDKGLLQQAREATNTLQWLGEAKRNYDAKFDRLVSELVSCGIDTKNFTVETIEPDGKAVFSFLVKDKEQTVHARFIYASGMIVIPHFRFIITRRANK